MSQQAYWDRVAWKKEFTIPPDLDLLRARLPADAAILDYGCGYGRVCRALTGAGFARVTGIDSSEEMIRRGQSQYPDLDLRCGGLDALGGPGAFDAALLVAVLTCIPQDVEQRQLMAALSGVLRPGGWLFISDYLLQEDERNRERYRQAEAEFGVYGVFRLPEGAVMRHHTREWIRELTAGFAEQRFAVVDAVTMNGHAAQAFQYAGIKL